MATMAIPRPNRRNALARVRRTGLATLGATRAVSAAARKTGAAQARRQARRGSGRGRLAVFIAGLGAGAAAGYLLDPQDGRRRRQMLRDRLAAALRRGKRETGRQIRYTTGKAEGVVAEATPPGRDASELNDPALEAKVESELFRPAEAPKGTVNVSVEKGVVFLRGEVPTQEELEALVRRAEEVDGVSETESLLHLPGEPAPRA